MQGRPHAIGVPGGAAHDAHPHRRRAKPQEQCSSTWHQCAASASRRPVRWAPLGTMGSVRGLGCVGVGWVAASWAVGERTRRGSATGRALLHPRWPRRSTATAARRLVAPASRLANTLRERRRRVPRCGRWCLPRGVASGGGRARRPLDRRATIGQLGRLHHHQCRRVSHARAREPGSEGACCCHYHPPALAPRSS